MDRLEAMQVLLAVVDAGSLSAGSRKLNAPLPSVSRKVAELERHLGAKLLIRTSRNVQLTDAGRDYVEAARQIMNRLQEAERRASGEYQAPRGELSVTMPVEFGRRYVLPIAMTFLEKHPEVSLNIVSVDRVLPLVEQHIDVGIRLGPLADSGLYALKLGEIRMLTCASPSYLDRHGRPAAPADLADHDAIMFAGLDSMWWVYGDGEDRVEASPRARVRVNTATASVAAAVAGLGMARALDYQVADELKSGALVRVLEDHVRPPIPVHLIYPRQGLLALKVRAFLDWTAPRLRERLQELRELY